MGRREEFPFQNEDKIADTTTRNQVRWSAVAAWSKYTVNPRVKPLYHISISIFYFKIKTNTISYINLFLKNAFI